MPILFDSSIYISALRAGNETLVLLRRWANQSPLWLSSVVLEELYAGAAPSDHAVLNKLEHDFERAHRVLIPNLSDWSSTGRVLSRLGRKYGYERIGQARLTNDALIAMSAARMGITIFTANERDFALLGEFRSFSWETRTMREI
jgi:predicted nucleic acid-binding protein